MDGETRRREILQALQCGEQPISASRLAKQFQVSRQIIVGDIALLRAGGEAILATARGYILEEESQGVVVKIAVCHRSDQVKEELQSYTTFLKGYHHDMNAILGELNDNGKTVSMPAVSFSLNRLIL